MYCLKGIKKTVSLVVLTTFIFTNAVYATPDHSTLRPALQSNKLFRELARTTDLKKFSTINQQLYLDGVTWEQIESGEFERLVKEQGISGVTTNPPLIKKYLASKAVQKRAGELSKQFAAEGLSREEVQARVYRELIADLAERVIQVFLHNGVKDATFSIEIDPTKADDVEASVRDAMEWLNIKDGQYRDNILVKVAVTEGEQGYEIIRQVTAKGGNVNATVILTPKQYDKVAEAYIHGLEEAAESNIDLSRIRSVASFFVSRWDVKLAQDLSEDQQGKVGNAVAIVAYNKVYKKLFESDRFRALQAKGANVQKFLLASTGSKAKAIADRLKKKPEYKGKDNEVYALTSKAYPYDVYVSPLQGAGTINTLPYDTIAALIEQGFIPREEISQPANFEAAERLLREVARSNRKDIEEIGRVLLQEGLQSFVDDYLDVQRTLAGIVSYPVFRDGVNSHIEASGVDSYSPLPGTPSLRKAVAGLINSEILNEQGLQVSLGEVTISLGTAGLLELLSRIFLNIEGAALKKPGQKDIIALSPHALPLYNQKSVFGRAADLKAENPKMMVIDSLDIEADKLERLLAQASKNGTIVVFLDNDSGHKNIGQVYKLLSKNKAYKTNTVIVTDISRRFGLPEYNVGAFVTFNKAIKDAYNAAAGGSIAAVSTNSQAGFAKLIGWQLANARELEGEKVNIVVDENKDVINTTYRNMEPDPTLAISPTGNIARLGLPTFVLDNNKFSAFMKTLEQVLGEKDAMEVWLSLVDNQVTIPISTYEDAFSKAANSGLVRRLETADHAYAEKLFVQYKNDQKIFLGKLFHQPNPEIVEILKGAKDYLSSTEIMQLMMVFSVKKMHVGAPGFPRDDTGKAALQLPEDRLTPEQIETGLVEAGVFFANNVFGLSFGPENVVSGFYGSKPVIQDVLTAFQSMNGREAAVAVPKPYYVGYKSSQLGAGIPLRNIAFFDTKTSQNWVPTPTEVKEAFNRVNPAAQKVLLLTTPDNPSGTAVPQGAIEELLEVTVRNDAFIIFDVAYARLLFKGNTPANLGQACENIFRRLDSGLRQRKGIMSAKDLTRYFLIMQTQSKELLHPGSRLGAAMSGNTALIKHLRENKILEADPIAKKAQAIIYGPSYAEYARTYTAQHNEYLERNIDYICNNFTRLDIHFVRPEGAFYILFRIGKGPYIRFSFAGPYADMIQVMARIERLYPKWKKEGVNLTSDQLFKEAGITSVPGGAFGAPDTKAEEDAIEARQVADVDAQAEPFTWQDYAEFAKLIRYYILRSLYLAGSGHANTALSDVEILQALYVLGGMRYDSRDPEWEYRDRFVDKGHAYQSIYATLANLGFFPTEDLETVRQLGSHLSGHVTVDTPGIDANTGILGQSLSIALGMAINATLEGTNYTTFCNIGDGETQEGQIYAAVETASFLTEQGRMSKLVAMIDWNQAERDGWVKNYGTVNIKNKWEALGWQVLEVDGHDPFAIKAAIDQAKTIKDKPTAIICATQKGRGVSFLSEGDNAWLRHGTPPKNAQEYFDALKQILGQDVTETEDMQVGNTTVKVDKKEKTLAKLFNMPRINRLVEAIKERNARTRSEIEAETVANPHLQPVSFVWDGQPAAAYKPGTAKPTRQAIGEFFVQLIKARPELRDRLAYMTMDLEESAVLHKVGEEVPEMRYRMGIREDVTASAAVGISLASHGRIIPVVATFDPFLPNMAAQLRIAQQTPGVKIIVYMSHAAALDTGDDGPTHQSEASAMIARALNLDTYEPPDANTAWDNMNNILNSAFNGDPDGRVYYIRGTRGTDLSSKVWGFKVDPRADSFLVWESDGINEANKPDGIIVAAGAPMVNLATQAAKKLDGEGKKIRVICVQHFSGVDREGSEFLGLIEPGVPIVTAQDAYRIFLSGLVNDAIDNNLSPDWGSKPWVKSVGIGPIHDKVKGISFRGGRGEALAAYDRYGMGPDGIADTIRNMISNQERTSIPINRARHEL